MQKIAITLIAYNRTTSLSRLLSSLCNAHYDGDEVPLFISIDKSNTDKVEKFAEDFQWTFGEKTVVKHDTNIGLRRHILEQGRLLKKFDAIVVLEDDVIVSPDFWNYTKQTVEKYHNCNDIAGISLYSYAVNYHERHPFIPLHDGNDVFFMNCAMSWGQIWMRNQWHAFMAWYEKNTNTPFGNHLPNSISSWSEKSWLKYHMRYCIEENKYFVFPYVSYSTNYSDVGTHMTKEDSIFQVPILQGRREDLRLPDLSDKAIRYDGFFENKTLYSSLGLQEDACCLDLNRTNTNKTGKRYWLSTRLLPYKVITSYSCACRPIEQNVLSGNTGSGIFLYDTTIKSKSLPIKGNPAFLAQHYVQSCFFFVRDYGFQNLIREFFQLIKKQIGL